MSTTDQMGLFGAMETAKPKIRPWRKTKLDLRQPGRPFDPTDLDDVADAADVLFDVLVRSQEFSRACQLRDLKPPAEWLERFAEADSEVARAFVVLRLESDRIEDLEGQVLGRAREAAARMAELRIEWLESVEAEELDQFLKIEPRVRTVEADLWRELAAFERAFAEANGQLQEVELPISARSAAGGHGLILAGDVDVLMDGFLREMKEEQDSKPLPKQGKLATLLKGIPVVWLDAMARCHQVEIEGSRKDREKKIAESLCDPVMLIRIFGSCLDTEERELLERLLKEGGQMPAAAIYEEFGSDESDGWFWNEEPPDSTLGWLRVHGLVFVGKTEDHGRTAMIPKELRAALGELLGR